MKYLKMLAIAALAAMALMAIGSSAASATKLCEDPYPPEAATCLKPVASGTVLKFVAEGKITETGPFGEVVDSCEESTVETQTSNAGSSSETVKDNVKVLTFSKCLHPVTTVNTSGVSQLGSTEIHKIAGVPNGTITSNGTTITMHETLFGTCHFLTSNTDFGTLTGKDYSGNATPGTPTIDLTLKWPSENCGFTATWEGSYKYSGTTPFNVTNN